MHQVSEGYNVRLFGYAWCSYPIIQVLCMIISLRTPSSTTFTSSAYNRDIAMIQRTYGLYALVCDRYVTVMYAHA